MATLEPEERLYYKNLYSILNEKNITDLLNRHVQGELDKAVRSIKSAEDPLKIGRLQGKIEAFEHILKLKDTVTHIIRTGV